jgi:hypothetical protein
MVSALDVCCLLAVQLVPKRNTRKQLRPGAETHSAAQIYDREYCAFLTGHELLRVACSVGRDNATEGNIHLRLRLLVELCQS